MISYVQNEQDTEEIIQDTLLAVIDGLTGRKSTFRHESSFKTWVYSIAINKSKDHLKYRHRKKRFANIVSISKESGRYDKTAEPSTYVHPGIELEQKEHMELLFTGINKLSENQKQVLILARFEQMPIKEIAQVLNLTSKAVESHLSRARVGIKKYLESINY